MRGAILFIAATVTVATCMEYPSCEGEEGQTGTGKSKAKECGGIHSVLVRLVIPRAVWVLIFDRCVGVLFKKFIG